MELICKSVIYNTLLFYYLCCHLRASSFGPFPVFPFLSDPCFLRPFPIFLCRNPLLLIFLCGIARTVCGWGEGGVSWVVWRRSLPRASCYAGVRFSLPTRFPIPDPSLATCSAWDWGVVLRESYVSNILQPRFQCDCLSTPIRAKGDCPCFLPWFDSIA